MAKKVVLVTRPNYDLPTMYLHNFSGEAIKNIKFVGEYAVIDLEKGEVTRENLEKSIKKSNPRLIILNGHGSKKTVFGHKHEVILEESNVDLLDSRIIYAVACDSSEELGEIAVDEGNADAYVGYDARFMIIVDPSKTAAPAKDKNIKPFRKVYAIMILSLVSGLTVAKSIEKTKQQIRSLIREYGVYGVRDKYGDAPLIRWALYWDLYFLKAHGNLEAVV